MRALAVAEPEPAEEAALAPPLRAELERLLAARYDPEHGGWGFAKKFLDWDAVEYSMARARAGDREAERRAQETLAGERRLVEPVWGGVYQYSHGELGEPALREGHGVPGRDAAGLLPGLRALEGPRAARVGISHLVQLGIDARREQPAP